MKDLDLYGWIAFITVLVGGIITGLEGITGSNLLVVILGPFLGRFVLVGIGAAAGYLGYMLYLSRYKKIA